MKPSRLKENADPVATTWRGRLADYLGLERNVAASSLAVLLLGFGEELWKKFLPKYLEVLGAGPGVIGLYGTSEDFFDALYQYPGGWLADRAGRRRAFLIFIAVASVGYFTYLVSPSWPFLFLGLAFAMAWHSMASPAIFAVIGDALPKEKRAIGFTLQSMLKRIPMVISPLIGGALIAKFGIQTGIRGGLAVTLLLAAITLFLVRAINVPVAPFDGVKLGGVWRSFHTALKRLLISDIFIRTCEGIADIFVILYATNIIGISTSRYGLLVAIQITTSILVYIPSGKVADRIGRKPFVIVTFLCFAVFPLSVVRSSGFASLVIAFVIGGLREIGEPSRKALIVDFAEPRLRARTVGLYYLVRSLTITPAAAIGGMLWKVSPQTPFYIAFIIGLLGAVIFAFTVEEKYAG